MCEYSVLILCIIVGIVMLSKLPSLLLHLTEIILSKVTIHKWQFTDSRTFLRGNNAILCRVTTTVIQLILVTITAQSYACAVRRMFPFVLETLSAPVPSYIQTRPTGRRAGRSTTEIWEWRIPHSQRASQPQTFPATWPPFLQDLSSASYPLATPPRHPGTGSWEEISASGCLASRRWSWVLSMY